MGQFEPSVCPVATAWNLHDDDDDDGPNRAMVDSYGRARMTHKFRLPSEVHRAETRLMGSRHSGGACEKGQRGDGGGGGRGYRADQS